MSILYVSHDLLSVATISHRVAVMEQGQIVECRETAGIFTNPEHPYTQRLIAALPSFAWTKSVTASGWKPLTDNSPAHPLIQ
jgi:ABC-type dipeptide/oligopeptide/nickel transport system ATPase component